MEYAWLIIAPTVAAFAAIVAPLLTTIKTNKHQRQLKELELIYLKKYEAYNNLFESYTLYKTSRNVGDFYKVSKSIGSCMLLSSKPTRLTLGKLLTALSTKQENYFVLCDEAFDLCVPQMCDELQDTKNKVK